MTRRSAIASALGRAEAPSGFPIRASSALSKTSAPPTRRAARCRTPVSIRAHANLALVVGLQGRFEEAETLARADLPPEGPPQRHLSPRDVVAAGQGAEAAQPQAGQERQPRLTRPHSRRPLPASSARTRTRLFKSHVAPIHHCRAR